MQLSDEFFKRKKEQSEIRVALEKAIPDNAEITNVILVLAQLQVEYTNLLIKELEKLR